MKKYVFIDIDGTLYDNGNGCIPSSALKALELAKRNGHELFICTGRPKPVVENSYLDLPITGVIYSGGTHIEVNQKVIFEKQFPLDKMQEIEEYLNRNHFDYTLEGTRVNLYTKGNFKFFKDYFCTKLKENTELQQRFEDRSVIKMIEDAQDQDLSQITKVDVFAANDERIHDYIANLPEGLEGFVYSEPMGDVIEAEILIAGISKASGINEVLNYFGGKIEDTVAIGDSTNDMAMIEHAQIGIAMGNACSQLKEAADMITTDVDKDGLYNAFVKAGLI